MKYELNLKDFLLFELKSWIGRNFIRNKPKLKNSENYLNLGCGDNYIEGYINADFFCRFKFWKKDIRKLEWQLDLRYPLQCNDEVFDGIFTEHTLEHLSPNDSKKLLGELYRILKQDAIVRITIPDIEKYIKFYNKEYDGYDSESFQKIYKTGCSAIQNITQNYLHFSVWDFEELKRYLEEVGFKDIVKQDFGITQNKKLNLDLNDRAWETLYVEAKK